MFIHTYFQVAPAILYVASYLVPVVTGYIGYFLVTFFFQVKQPDAFFLFFYQGLEAGFHFPEMLFFLQFTIQMHVFFILHKLGI